MPNILQQLGPDAMASLRQIAEQYNRGQQAAGGPAGGAAGVEGADVAEADDEDDVPELVEADSVSTLAAPTLFFRNH